MCLPLIFAIGEEVFSNKSSQFGKTSLFTLIEAETGRGQYSIEASNGKYLSVDSSNKLSANKSSKGRSHTAIFY